MTRESGPLSADDPSDASLGACPSDECVAAYASGELEGALLEEVERHLAACPACFQRWEQTTPIESFGDLLDELEVAEEDEPALRDLQSTLLGERRQIKGPLPRELAGWDAARPLRVRDYQLLRQIGSGASSRVFLAKHLRLEREFVVKLFSADLSRRPDALARFAEEMRSVGRLDHPHIVHATDAGEADGVCYLAMEYEPGADLSTVLAKCGPLSAADACEICRQAALGLEHAHEHGLVHRDIKPSNLLLTDTSTVKVLDLGLASLPRAMVGDAPEPRGTPDYMAPEQWEDSAAVDRRADVYALGCTLYKLMTGAAPFSDSESNLVAKRTAHQEAMIPSLKELRRDLPSGLSALAARMLAKRPEDRPADAAECARRLSQWTEGADLAALLRRCDVTPRPAPAAGGPRVDPKTRRRLLVAGAALLVGFVLNRALTTRDGPSPVYGGWRSLTPAPIGELDFEAPGTEILTNTGERTWRLSPPGLVSLGQPFRDAYLLDFAVRLPAAGAAGAYFAWSEDSEGNAEFLALVCERGVHEGMEAPVRLTWRKVSTRIDGAVATDVEDRILGEMYVEAASDSDWNQVRVGVGAPGFPRVSWNGVEPSPEKWRISEASQAVLAALISSSKSSAERNIGWFALESPAEFARPQLRYAQ